MGAARIAVLRVRALSRLVLLLGAVVVWMPADARATVAPTAVRVTSASTAAGAAADTTFDIDLATGDGDDAKDLTLSLAKGLVANPQAVVSCAEQQFTAGRCDAGADVGSGTLTIDTPIGPQTATASLYLVGAAPGQVLPRIGLDISALGGLVVIRQLGGITVRTEPDTGLDVTFTGLPRTASVLGLSLDIFVRHLSLTLKGTVAGRPFVRLPTGCGAASSTVRVVSYAGASATGSGSFTPTGCVRLPFAPAVSSKAEIQAGNDSLALNVGLAFGAADASLREVTIVLPVGALPRFSRLDATCPTATAPADCPDAFRVGSVAVATPLLADPLLGKVVVSANPHGLPVLSLVLPAPVPLTLRGAVRLGTTPVVTFDGLPDIPLSSLEVTLDPGPNSFLQARLPLCVADPTIRADSTGHNDADATTTAKVPVRGQCPDADGNLGAAAPGRGTATSGTTGASGVTSTASSSAVDRLRGQAHLSRLTTRPSLRLTLRLPADSPTRQLGVQLPSGLSLTRKRGVLPARADGRKVSARFTAETARRLTLRLPRAAGSRVTFTLGGDLVASSAALRARARRAPAKLRLVLTATAGTARHRLSLDVIAKA